MKYLYLLLLLALPALALDVQQGTITATTTKNNLNTAVPFTVPIGPVMIQCDADAYVYFGADSATASTSSVSVRVIKNVPYDTSTTTNRNVIAVLPVSGTVNCKVFQIIAMTRPRRFSPPPDSAESFTAESMYAKTFISTQSDGGPSVIVPQDQRIYLSNSGTPYITFDGGSVGIYGAELDVPWGFTDSQKVNASVDITPRSIISQAATGQYGYRALHNSLWDWGNGTTDYCQSIDNIMTCAGPWDHSQVGTQQLNPKTTGGGVPYTSYVGDGFRFVPLGSAGTCTTTDHTGKISVTSGDGRLKYCDAAPSTQVVALRGGPWSSALNFGAIGNGDCAVLTFTATGAVAHEAVACGGIQSLHAADARLVGYCDISATDTAWVKACCNYALIGGDCADPDAITFQFTAAR